MRLLLPLTQNKGQIWPLCINDLFKSYSRLSCTSNFIQFRQFGSEIWLLENMKIDKIFLRFGHIQSSVFLVPIIEIEWNFPCRSVLSRTWIKLLFTMVKFDPCVAWESSKVAPIYDPPHQSMTLYGMFNNQHDIELLWYILTLKWVGLFLIPSLTILIHLWTTFA